MTERHHLRSVPSPSQEPKSGGAGQNGGGGNDVEARLRKVEEALTVIKTTLAHVATREDIQKMQNNNLRWIIGILIAVIALFAREIFFK